MDASVRNAFAVAPTDRGFTAKSISRRTVRSRVHHLRWRERIATLIGQLLNQSRRIAWAASADVDPSAMESFSCVGLADRKTVRVVDVLFMPRAERQAFLSTIEEWASAIERGDL